MLAWQDKNGSFAGQKWEAWQKIISNTPHFESFSVIFVCFLPLLVGFCHTFLYFSHFCLFFSHLSSNLSISRTVWQDSLAEKIGTAAWQNKWPPLAGRNFGRKGLNFGRMKLLAPPKKWPRYAYEYEAQYESGMLNHKIFLFTLFQTLTVTHRLHVCLVSWIVAPMANWNIFYFLNFLSIVLSRQRSTIEGNFDISGEIYFLSTGHRWGGKIDQWWLNFLVSYDIILI